jgi:5-methyltetrahydrofolate--homocysteine methyltransferase
MRTALDEYTPRPRPTIDEIVDKIGPLRNKTASESGGDGSRERRRRRS